MKYINASDKLPEALINQIKAYVDGVYIYIPRLEAKKRKWGSVSKSRREFDLRNERIYEAYLRGKSLQDLCDSYFLSDKSIRRILLQEKKKYEVEKMKIQNIVENWEVQGAIQQISACEWLIGHDHQIKIYKDLRRLKRSLAFLTSLREEGLLVPKIIPLVSGESYWQDGEGYYLMTSHLQSEGLLEEMHLTTEWYYDFGQTLGRLHLALKACENKMSYWNNSLLEEMKGWVLEALEARGLDYLDLECLHKAIEELEAVNDALPRQLIHRNVFVGTFLYDAEGFKGYSNFDLGQGNIRLFDPCYFLLGLLSEGRVTTMEPETWLTYVKATFEGYESLVGLSLQEKEAVVVVMKNIELLFIAYFIREDKEDQAQEAYKIFSLVCELEEAILETLRNL